MLGFEQSADLYRGWTSRWTEWWLSSNYSSYDLMLRSEQSADLYRAWTSGWAEWDVYLCDQQV